MLWGLTSVAYEEVEETVFLDQTLGNGGVGREHTDLHSRT